MYSESVDRKRFYAPVDEIIRYLKQIKREAAERNQIVTLSDDYGYIEFHYHDSCEKCRDLGYTVVCGWCESNTPHGSCDDTFAPDCDCVMGKERQKLK